MGKIKKILENELIGGTQQTDVYPITSTKAIYDENNERLDNVLEKKFDKVSVVQESGEAEDKVMSQKATTAAIADETTRAKAAEEAIIFDVSAHNNGAVFESLQALLSSSNLNTLIPTSVRHGGMSILFVQSSDNKYVQYRYMGTNVTTTVTFTNTANWQGVDDEPTVGSDNLVKSGGVAKALDTFSDIHKEPTAETSNQITICDDNDEEVVSITPDGVDAKNLKSNGKDVLTEHQDISNLVTKEYLEGIEHESTVEEEEEVVFEDENGNLCARVNHRGLDSVGYALNGNPITKTHEPSNQCKGLTHYYHEGGDTIQYTYNFTKDSYIIYNPNGVNGNIYAEIIGLKAGKTYRISGIGSGITSTKRICASNVVSGLNNTIAELEDNGESIYSAEFTVLENTITTINIAPRYNSKLTSFTNIKVIEVSDVERSVLVNDFIDNISLEELSDDLKKHLSIDENPTTYCGRSACVFNNVLFIGDSLTEGAFNKKGTNGMSDASGSFYRQEYSYPSFFKKLTGANGENWGLGGHTTKEWWDVRTTEGHPSYKPDDQWKGFDCAIIALGTNDAFRSSSASDTTTALNNIINKVLSLNQRISVFVATPFGGRFALDSKFTEVSETIRSVVNGRTDCYLLDINRYGHMNDKRGYNAGHFTAIGYERLAEDIINYMSWIIDSNDWDFRHVQFSNTDYEPFN